LVFLAACLLAAGCGRSSSSAQPPPPDALPATVINVSERPLPLLISAVGRTEGSKEVEVRARVSGIIARQAYEEGSTVRAGDLLFLIEPAPFEIALAHARAALAAEQAKNEQARRDVARHDNMLAQNVLREQEAEDNQTTRRASDAAVLAAEANVREAQLNLSYTRVTAPIAGITGRAYKSEGSLVTPNTDSSLLTTIVQTDPIWVRFALSEGENGQLRAALNGSERHDISVRVAGNDSVPAGKLIFAASTLDTQLGTVQLRAEFPNKGLMLLPGQHVGVELTAGARPTIAVPKTAVLNGDEGRFVWVVGADGKVAQRPVQTGPWVGDDWVISSGLSAGDSVVVDNLQKLRPGMAVRQ
jgi:membrane fusion protein (multidrug efflux system)